MILPMLTLILGLGAPAEGPKTLTEPGVEVEFDKDVDFSRYKTFAWVPHQEPASNPANHIRITRAVERELQAKGLAKAEAAAPADVYVYYQGRIEKKVQSTSGPTESPWKTTPDQQWKVSFDIKRAQVGTLVLELLDGQKKDVVWRGKGSELIRSPDEAEELINSAVNRLLAAYPPKP